ncbi:MAG: peptidoglycan-binding protein [Candidatus Pacebacteria bacterium]|nr:peptidoglycan-binding protein [Candidatus Paceibacterota bacterium]
MKKIYSFITMFATLLTFGALNFAYAITPTLSLSSTGTGDNVRIVVAGDPSSSVQLEYTKSGVGLYLDATGYSTDSTGNTSFTVSSSVKGVSSGSAVRARVNGQYSSSVSWPTVSTSSSNLTLSQTGIVLSAGQSSSISANNNSLYLLNNSNAQVANFNISNNQITVTGNSNGSTTATICVQGGASNCASVSVTVQAAGTSALTFSQSNVTVFSGQTIPVTISGGSGYYMISSNPNSNVVLASISGSIVNLSTSSTSGSSSITICSTNMSSCGVINVTVGTASSTAVTFSQSNPILSIGQSTSISLSGGGSNTYSVNSNSNSTVVQATINSNVLTLHGLASGSSIITVCSSAGSCNTLTATTNYVSTGGSISLSQSSATLIIGQTLSVSISGGDAPYNLPSNGGSIFQATLNGNIVNINGLSSGSMTIPVCSAGGGCTNLSVTVSGTGSLVPILVQSSLSLTVGQSGTVNITNTGSFYVSNNSNQNIASATINGTMITVSALNAGSNSVTVCQTGGQCSVLSITVSANSSSGSVVVSSTSFLSFSDKDPVFEPNKSGVITVSGGSGTYSVAYNSNPSISRLSISGNNITFTGLSTGTAIVVLCSSSGNACGAISLTIGSSAVTPVVNPIKLTPSAVSLKVNKAAVVIASGGSGTYSVNVSDKEIASAIVVRNYILLTGKKVGTTAVSVCSSGKCASLALGVTANNSTSTVKYKFTKMLSYGSIGEDVKELQKRLLSEKIYKGLVTGMFDQETLAAVRLYQKNNGIRQTGNVGDETMAALNN